jgi:hypothetical protein
MRQKLKPLFGSLLSSNKNSSKSNKEPKPESIKPDSNSASYDSSDGWSTNSTVGYGNKDDSNDYNHENNCIQQGDEVEPYMVYIPNLDGFTHEGEFAVEVSRARYV